MGLFSKKTKKSPYVVEERSKDDVPYVIPHITSNNDLEELVAPDKFVAPMEGRDAKDEKAEQIYKSDIEKSDISKYNYLRGNYGQDDNYKDFPIINRKSKEETVSLEPPVEEVQNNTEVKEEIEKIDTEAPTFDSKNYGINDLINNNVPKFEEPVENSNEELSIFTAYEEDEKDKPIDSSYSSTIFKVEEEKPKEMPKPVEDVKVIPIVKVQDVKKEPIEEPKIYIPPKEEKQEPAEVSAAPMPAPIIEEDENSEGFYTPSELAIIKSGHTQPNYQSFIKPPLNLLQEPTAAQQIDKEWVNEQIEKIDANLEAFKIDGKVVEYTAGPTFTRYSINLGVGEKGNKIENIQNDLQRTLEATSIRIENPIPGKPYVGIEVPNKKRRSVMLKELLNNKEFLESDDPLLVPVGLDVEGKGKYVSLVTLPHGLVAGSSGSGKSVFLNALVCSLMYRNTPEDVRLFFIDPKQVDLVKYAKSPYLLAPNANDPKEGVQAIKWLVDEMNRRFKVFAILHVSDLKGYRKAIKDKPGFKKIPYIVCIIDEAGDFLMNGGPEAMEQITILIQKCRSAGIHLLISMQKPVAKVISTTIKSNASGRFALRVAQSQDSMVILDSPGAEKLLGNGDMIFQSNSVAGRFQSAYVSDEEIFAITKFTERQCGQDFFFTHEELQEKVGGDNRPGTISDELFPKVARYVVDAQKCSCNQISQDFKIGFNRANDIIKTMEYLGIVDESKGTKPREVLVDEIELNEILQRNGL